jgi:hypothetical protein
MRKLLLLFQLNASSSRPENPAYPLIDGTGCQILGVVKAVYREY